MYIKEYWPGGNKAIIRTDLYNKSFAHITRLVDEAKRDYPCLSNRDIQIVVYGGDKFRGTLGIEFIVDAAADEYVIIDNSEQALE